MRDWYADQRSFLEWRKKELSDVKSMAATLGEPYQEFCSRVALLVSYAHWEGAFSENSSLICTYLKLSGKRFSEVNYGFLLGFIDGELDRLRDRNHSHEARVDFVDFIGGIDDDADFRRFDEKVILARSNLNSIRVQLWCRILGRSPIFLEQRRVFLDYQLVKLRHEIAHGGSPKLRLGEIENLVDGTVSLIEDMSAFVLNFIEDT